MIKYNTDNSEHLSNQSGKLLTDAYNLLNAASITIRGAEAGGLQNRMEQLAYLAEQLSNGVFKIVEVQREQEALDVAAEDPDGS